MAEVRDPTARTASERQDVDPGGGGSWVGWGLSWPAILTRSSLSGPRGNAERTAEGSLALPEQAADSRRARAGVRSRVAAARTQQ